MLGWVEKIEEITLKNENFREVVFTGERTQVVLMSLVPEEEIGWEIHSDTDQFFRLEQGKVRIDLGTGEDTVDESHEAEDTWAFVVPQGTWHNVTNIGTTAVKLYTLYSPPHHPAGTIHTTKAEAEAAEEHH